MSIKRGTTQRGGRGRNFGREVAQRSSFQRQKGVSKMRGIQPTTQQKEKKVVTSRKRFPVRKVGQSVKDAAWKKQQAQRFIQLIAIHLIEPFSKEIKPSKETTKRTKIFNTNAYSKNKRQYVSLFSSIYLALSLSHPQHS